MLEFLTIVFDRVSKVDSEGSSWISVHDVSFAVIVEAEHSESRTIIEPRIG